MEKAAPVATPALFDAAAYPHYEFTPETCAIIGSDTPQGRLARAYMRYAEALVAEDSSKLVDHVLPDARLHDLEAIGYAKGVEGLIAFRRARNATFLSQRLIVKAMRFEGEDIIEADVEAYRSLANGRNTHMIIHARVRFLDGKVAERWDRSEPAPAAQ
jgi:hypothetical protein